MVRMWKITLFTIASGGEFALRHTKHSPGCYSIVPGPEGVSRWA